MEYTVLYMEQYDLNRIRAFVKVVESGSLTKASQILKMPKSRLSRWISQLEKEMGTQLLYRTTRQIQLTESGSLFFADVREHIAHLDRVGVRFQASSSRMEGKIKITAPVDFGNTYLADLLAEFSLLYPQVEFEVLLTQQVVDLVKESIDVALRIAHLKDSSLKARKIADMHSILVASPQYLSKTNINRFDDLSSTAALAFSPNGLSSWKLYRDSRLVSLKISPLFASNDAELVFSQVLKGRGVSLLPEYLCKEALSAGKLVHLFKDIKGPGMPLSLVSPESKAGIPRVKVFSEFVYKKLKMIL